jgi:hypothetical protein
VVSCEEITNYWPGLSTKRGFDFLVSFSYKFRMSYLIANGPQFLVLLRPLLLVLGFLRSTALAVGFFFLITFITYNITWAYSQAVIYFLSQNFNRFRYLQEIRATAAFSQDMLLYIAGVIDGVFFVAKCFLLLYLHGFGLAGGYACLVIQAMEMATTLLVITRKLPVFGALRVAGNVSEMVFLSLMIAKKHGAGISDALFDAFFCIGNFTKLAEGVYKVAFIFWVNRKYDMRRNILKPFQKPKQKAAKAKARGRVGPRFSGSLRRVR